MPDCAFQVHIPWEQRQYLGNWFEESTADVYTREKRHVVCSIWDQVLKKAPSLVMAGGREVRLDLSHEDWNHPVVEQPMSPKALFQEDAPPSAKSSWAEVSTQKGDPARIPADVAPPPASGSHHHQEGGPQEGHTPLAGHRRSGGGMWLATYPA